MTSIANMDNMERYGIQIPTTVLIKHVSHGTDDGLIDYIKQYAKPANTEVTV